MFSPSQFIEVGKQECALDRSQLVNSSKLENQQFDHKEIALVKLTTDNMLSVGTVNISGFVALFYIYISLNIHINDHFT